MRQNLLNFLGVTIAFAAGGAAIVGIVWASTVFGSGILPPDASVSWSQLTVQVVSFSVISGLVVDLVRFIGVRSWRPKPVYRFGMDKFRKGTLA